MPYVINSKCTACGKCKDECPVECIEADDIYKIDPDICIDCSICATICPVDAIDEIIY